MKFNESFFLQTQATSVESVTIYKNTSRPRSKKGCMYNLHVLEPTGIEVTKRTKINISIKDKNVVGGIDLYLHNTDDIKRISRIDTSIGKTVTIQRPGEIFFYIDSVKSLTLGENEKFNFTIYLEFEDNSSYLINPIFDFRENKISEHAILSVEEFKKQVLDEKNKEHGMLMISDNCRVYMPKSKYIPNDFEPTSILNLYESVIKSYNNLAGFNKKSDEFILRPREQFVLISARNKLQIGSVMIDTLPEKSYMYFNDYWEIFFQFAKLFEQSWSILEIWGNMYTIYMGNLTKGIDWLWETSRDTFENENIEPLYKKYLIENNKDLIKLNSKQEIYMLIALLESVGANFITSLEKYSRENKVYLTGIEYILYCLAKLFGLNAIPYTEMYGQTMLDKSLVSNIVDMSTSTILYIPFNEEFINYRDVSVPVTTKLVYIDDPVIFGIANPYAMIKVKIGDKEDRAAADFMGNFRYRIYDPIKLNQVIKISSREPHKKESISKDINVVTRLANNSINFVGVNGYLVAKVIFDTVNKQLIVVSTGQKYNISGISDIYFVLTLKDKKGRTKTEAYIRENENGENFKNTLHGKSFEYMDSITLSYKNEGFVFISKHEGKVIYTPKGESEKFNVTTCGLIEYFE